MAYFIINFQEIIFHVALTIKPNAFHLYFTKMYIRSVTVNTFSDFIQ